MAGARGCWVLSGELELCIFFLVGESDTRDLVVSCSAGKWWTMSLLPSWATTEPHPHIRFFKKEISTNKATFGIPVQPLLNIANLQDLAHCPPSLFSYRPSKWTGTSVPLTQLLHYVRTAWYSRWSYWGNSSFQSDHISTIPLIKVCGI